MMNILLHRFSLRPITLLACCLLWASAAQAETRQFGAFEMHYSVFASSFLQPDIAAAYGIVRGSDRGVLNIALRRGTEAVEARVSGTRGDLIRKEELVFRTIREDGAIYYIAEFGFDSAETGYFDISVTPEGETTPLRLEFQQALHAD